MITSFKRILQFDRHANDYLLSLENGIKTKLGHSLERILKQLPDIQAKHNEEQEDLQIDFANTDVNGSILRKLNDKKEWIYDMKPDSVKKHRAASNALFEEERYEIIPNICDEIPELTDEQKEAFKDFVI